MVWQFFRHGVEVLVYIVYVSVIGLAVERIVSRPLPAELGGTNPFAHVLMMGAVSVVALLLLRHIRADLSGRPPGRGMVRQRADVAVGMGMHAALGGAGGAAVAGAQGLGRRLRSGDQSTPWEQLDAATNDARGVHGAPQPGYEPVPNGGDGPDSAGETRRRAGGGHPVGERRGTGGATAVIRVARRAGNWPRLRHRQAWPRSSTSSVGWSREAAPAAAQIGAAGKITRLRVPAGLDNALSAAAAIRPARPRRTRRRAACRRSPCRRARYTGAATLPAPPEEPPPDDEPPPPDETDRGRAVRTDYRQPHHRDVDPRSAPMTSPTEQRRAFDAAMGSYKSGDTGRALDGFTQITVANPAMSDAWLGRHGLR